MKIVSVTLRENLASVDCESLTQELTAEPGISGVFFERDRNHRLTIEYDPAVLNESALLDSIYRHGIYPEPTPQRATAREMTLQ